MCSRVKQEHPPPFTPLRNANPAYCTEGAQLPGEIVLAAGRHCAASLKYLGADLGGGVAFWTALHSLFKGLLLTDIITVYN